MSHHGYFGNSQYIGSNTDEEVLSYFTPRQRVLVHLYYGEGWTQTQIGQIIGLGQTTISYELKRAAQTSASVLIHLNPTFLSRMRELAC